MASGGEDFLKKLAQRAVPGAGGLFRTIDALDEGIERLESKVGGLEAAADERLSRIERDTDRLSRLASRQRRPKPSRRASNERDSDQPDDAQGRS